MTERVDFDRLADYVGGALDGTPDAAEVRRLVDTDAEWAAAHDDLAAAMGSVSTDLHTLGLVDVHMPGEVKQQIDHYVRNLGSSNGAETASRAAEPAHDATRALSDGTRPGGRGPDESGRRPGGRVAGGGGPGRDRKRRTARWAAGLSAAAAVIAFSAGVIATWPSGSDFGSSDSAGSAADAPVAAPAAGGAVVISGRDYREGSFDGLGEFTKGVPMTTSNQRAGDQSDQGVKSNAESSVVPPELARFQQSQAALVACTEAVRSRFGGQIRVTDLARYEGRPAVVMLIDNAAEGGGRPLVVVAGEDCGVTPGNTDEVFHGPLA